MKKHILILSLLVVFLVLITKHSEADDQVIAMGDTFVSQLPADWTVKPGSWVYADIEDCYVNGPFCFGNNPTSPYGSPAFSADDGSLDPSFQFKQDEAVVIFFRTPPKSRYFGFTQYLMNMAGETKPTFASLSDTLNHLKVVTISESESVFDQYAVIVWTANLNSLKKIKAQLALQGIDEAAVNFIPLPIDLPLNLGEGSAADTFNMLLRTALPEVQQNLTDYIKENPFYVLKVQPTEVTMDPAPTIGYAEEETGIHEDPQLQVALNSLVMDIKMKYRGYSFLAQSVAYGEKTGWDCIFSGSQCLGDNHDALYSKDVSQSVKVKSLDDMVIIAGVNHQKTGKALYINHSVYDTVRLAGITAMADPMLTTQSALFHAGIRSLKDPKVKTYAQLYAYAISYNCNGMKFCLQIPAPTAENPIGLNPGEPFIVSGRSYVEPRTGVRPLASELIMHQVFIMNKK